jgi:hypothetical protein
MPQLPFKKQNAISTGPPSILDYRRLNFDERTQTNEF